MHKGRKGRNTTPLEEQAERFLTSAIKQVLPYVAMTEGDASESHSEEETQAAYNKACQAVAGVTIGVDVASIRMEYQKALTTKAEIADTIGRAWIRIAGPNRMEIECEASIPPYELKPKRLTAENGNESIEMNIENNAAIKSWAFMALAENGIDP